MLRAAGIVALVVLTACNQAAAKASPSPPSVVAQGNWTQNLTFKGEVAGFMSAIVADAGDRTSACTGARTHNGETWADYFYGTVDTSGTVWGVTFVIDNFRGPGTYLNSSVVVLVHSPDNSMVWQSRGADKVTFTLERSQQSGTVDAMMTNALTGKDGLHLTGSWNCRD